MGKRRRVEILLSKRESSNISQFGSFYFPGSSMEAKKEGGWRGLESVATSGSLSQHRLEPSVFLPDLSIRNMIGKQIDTSGWL